MLSFLLVNLPKPIDILHNLLLVFNSIVLCFQSISDLKSVNKPDFFSQLNSQIGPSGVRALPLAAGINEGGHYFRYFGPSVLRAPAEQTKVATGFGN